MDERLARALVRRMMTVEARASVALDTESAIHTCYAGHCGPGGKYRFIPSANDPDRGRWVHSEKPDQDDDEDDDQDDPDDVVHV